MNRIHFVTGTDTGVGKTVLAASLLYYFRRLGIHALAMKPFSSGQGNDVRILQQVQQHELRKAQCNPFHVSQPLAPWSAMRKKGRSIPLSLALKRIRQVQSQCDTLIVEGIGGLLVPLGRRYTVRDLISELGGDCDVWIAARNSLGTLNHCLLTLSALDPIKCGQIKLVLMECNRPDASSSNNETVLREVTRGIQVARMPRLGAHPVDLSTLKKSWKKIEKVLAPLLHSGNFCAPSPEGAETKKQLKKG